MTMQVGTAFGQFQTIVNADPVSVAEARRRRNLFRDAFTPLPDVAEVIASGSLARATQLDPIHDVDLIVVFAPDPHPDWGVAGDSADDALTYVAKLVMSTLGATNGTVATEVRLTSKRNHVVKCFLDDPKAENPFAVEVAAALRQSDGSLLLPERHNSRWITADPEYLITQVAGVRQALAGLRPPGTRAEVVEEELCRPGHEEPGDGGACAALPAATGHPRGGARAVLHRGSQPR